MTPTRLTSTLLATLVAALLFVAPQDAAAQKRDLQLQLSCPAVPMVADGLLRAHVSGQKENGAFVEKVAELYARRLDPTETLLTEPEFEKLEKRIVELVAAVRDGNCAEFRKLKKEQIDWNEQMEKYVRSIADDLEVDENRELDLDPDKRPRPKTDEEQAELRRALAEFQLANYIASDVDEKEARKKLVHRYELFTKRAKEQTMADVYGRFLKAYAAALDPHSTYFSPEDVEDFKIQMELSLQGIGAVLSSRDGLTFIEEIVPGGAADRHGKLEPKDQVIAVAQGGKKDGEEAVGVIDMDLRDVVKMIRGKKGTKVTLTILRDEADQKQRHRFTIVRDKIDLKQQAAKLKWREAKRGDEKLKLAIIELPSFYMGDERNSAHDVEKLVKEAKKGGADGLLLDLSRNGGGALKSAVEISGLFIEKGSIVGVGTPGKKARTEVLEDPDPKVRWDGPLVVLTSKISASASEILAGALKDYRRAVIVGDRHTFGKGSVQQLSRLPPGLGLLKVTTALYFLPGGKSTQSTGVTADIVIPSAFSKLDIGEKHQDHALDPVRTKAFKSNGANASREWKPVSSGVISKLEKKSRKRIAGDPEFKELAKELADVDPDDTRIKLAEILGEENGAGDEDEDEEGDDEDELSLQAKEAMQILADLAAR